MMKILTDDEDELDPPEQKNMNDSILIQMCTIFF